MPREAVAFNLGNVTNADTLPSELPAALATVTGVTSTLVRHNERTVRGWTTETSLHHHHLRCETPPDKDGAWWEYGLDLWSVTIAAGGFNGEDGDEDERRLAFLDERAALAAYRSASGESQ